MLATATESGAGFLVEARAATVASVSVAATRMALSALIGVPSRADR
jgi:hypothetical protein